VSDAARLANLFLAIQEGLPRQGPGTDDATLAALELCSGLTEPFRMLDIGCGPGMQTLAVARAREAQVVAVDLEPTYLTQLRDAAADAGLRGTIATRRLDMSDLPFADGAFDVVWSEGAAYVIGVPTALEEWGRLIRPGGYLVVSDLCWTTAAPPQPLAEFFAEEYPSMTAVESRTAEFARRGYELVGHFTLPEVGWWLHYYEPLERKLPALRERYAHDDAALDLIESTQTEIDMRRRYPDAYGYEYFVARLGG
jgi:ubiquinone/menaquinone biosynthesis C-methylase UbiE